MVTISRVSVKGSALPAFVVTKEDTVLAYAYTGAPDGDIFVHVVGKDGTVNPVAQVLTTADDVISMLEKAGL